MRQVKQQHWANLHLTLDASQCQLVITLCISKKRYALREIYFHNLSLETLIMAFGRFKFD